MYNERLAVVIQVLDSVDVGIYSYLRLTYRRKQELEAGAKISRGQLWQAPCVSSGSSGPKIDIDVEFEMPRYSLRFTTIH